VTRATLDGNEAAVSVAYRLSELCTIFPITPASPMAELADEWSAEGRRNVFGSVPSVVELQSEGGAAGALHGAGQGGALATSFTASQGLLLMIPDLYKIAGELTATVIHVAARAVATQALSIFGDHSDVMAVRATGFGILGSSSVQEAHDLAAVAHAASLAARVPFVHFFDGFRTSHELTTIETLSDEDLVALIPSELVLAHRRRRLSPDHPVVRGTSHNPDVAFQAREAANPFYAAAPGLVEDAMRRLGERTGRHYGLVDYAGDPEADRVVVAMGSGAETLRETAARLCATGERVGVATVHLYRPFPADALARALPPSVRRVAVLDRTKEPGSLGEPLLLDVLGALVEAHPPDASGELPLVVGGRYGLASKEFTPAMAAAVFEELARDRPRRRFTVGITDDVSGTSLPVGTPLDVEPEGTRRAVFFGVGSDGTVSAAKATVRILGDAGLFAQGYFVYDSKKSGSETVSHVRFGTAPIRAPYLVDAAEFVGCHEPSLLRRAEVLDRAAPGATLLLNCPWPAEEAWDQLPRPVQERILELGLSLWAVDATRLAREAGVEGRVNTVLQACFFAITGVLGPEGIDRVKVAVETSYKRAGRRVVAANIQAVERGLEALARVPVPGVATSGVDLAPVVPDDAPPFVRTVTAAMLAGRGDELPVSALPVDGTWPSGTAVYEKRNASEQVAVWSPDACIQCGRCALVCPHSVIRATFCDRAALAGAPPGFKAVPLRARGMPEAMFALAVYLEDCTGCGLCVEACPVIVPGEAPRRAIDLGERAPLVEVERERLGFFERLPAPGRTRVDFGLVRGVQFLRPLFEFPGACAGCGETPYLKLVSQLFGDRAVIANATGCSSIYGGNLPTTPWTVGPDGRGPAWSNSLFEDNAEFGLGLRLAIDHHAGVARRLLGVLRDLVGHDLADELLAAPQRTESELAVQRERVAELRRRIETLDLPEARELESVLEHLVRRSVFVVGGDGWAYDIGAAGLDHVLASGRDLNVLVLDTEVYSNTGGQMSKATPLGAVAKFAAAGKTTEKKDLALQAIAYGTVYVARVAMGADPQQCLRAFREAEAYDGPSLILAYSPCIAHGIDLREGLAQQYRAVASGAWPLLRYDPVLRAAGENPFLLDSPRPQIPLSAFTGRELRFTMLERADPLEAERLADLAQQAVQRRFATYEEMATRPASAFARDGRRTG
jgi:pyruvate-ferredoxin/flavodoxin oxidoreductase